MRREAVGLAALMVLLLSGCWVNAEDEVREPDSAGSLRVAQQRVVASVRDAVADAVGPGASIVRPTEFGEPSTEACGHPDSLGYPPPGSPESTTYRFDIRGAEPTMIRESFRRFAQHFESAGWRREESSVTGEDLAVWKRAHYTVVVRHNPTSELFAISGSTPCLMRR